uniref:BUB1 N-terminal domain-containing protein n=1 Tax=Eptatretus burgeri TaxID=7764 RepID=A0A8C4QVQ1_EPTBU
MAGSQLPEDEAWERDKENVKLLRGGRPVESLNLALQAPENNEMCVLLQKQRQFELDLRFYDGDDPLSVWDRFIAWTEQMFPQGGKGSKLLELLERLLQTFVDDERYRNSQRFLNHCLKLASMMKEPLDVYSFLSNRGIGKTLALLYINWAQEYEARGDMVKADEVYRLGLQHHAQPLELL